MSKRIYHLTIEYDNDTDEVEYLVETVEQLEDDEVRLVEIGSVDISKYFSKEVLKELALCYEMGEA
tara:strand:- start:301 stop:498 length:198 start_codon:yes stop_codon:yes gene_type:complete